jgi:Ser/Thr protein kinase RdoA (MazF antagonist)
VRTVYSAHAIGNHALMESLSAIAAQPPTLAQDLVARAVREQFGQAGDYAPLVSERDQNFCLNTADGRRYVVKVTSLAELPETSDFQLGALLHLEGAPIDVPTIVKTSRGDLYGHIDAGADRYRLRVVTWVEGEPLLDAGIDVRNAARLGDALGRLDNALHGYSHPGENPVLLWDLQRAGELRPLLDCIDDEPIRRDVLRVVDDFEAHVRSSELPTQVIHGDANPENVLVRGDRIGFIDFGDMVRAPRVFDVAIAAAYLRCDGDDPLVFIRPFIAGYHAAAPLAAGEARVLFDLIRARLATTVTLLYWRLRDRPGDDDYRRKSLQVERTASRFLARLDEFGREKFDNEIKGLLNVEP